MFYYILMGIKKYKKHKINVLWVSILLVYYVYYISYLYDIYVFGYSNTKIYLSGNIIMLHKYNFQHIIHIMHELLNWYIIINYDIVQFI